MRRRARLFAAGLLAVAAMGPAQAAFVTFGFSGRLDSAGLGLAAGSAVSGRFTFDADAPDSRAADPTEGLYFSGDSASGWIVDLGGQVLTTQPGGGSRVAVQVFDGHPSSAGGDGWVASGFGLAGALGSFTIALGNLLEPATRFTSDALPTTPPTLAARVGELRAADGSGTLLRFSIDSLGLSSNPFPGSIAPPPPPDPGGSGGTGSPPATPTLDPAACTATTDAEARVLCLVNDVRRRSGLQALVADAALADAAAAHTLDMRSNGFFAHEGSDGSTFVQRALHALYDGQALSQLLGNGFADADAMVQAWLDDAPHRQLLLSTRADEAGIDARFDGGQRLWTMLLGQATDAPAAVPLPPTLPLVLAAAAAALLQRRRR